MKLTPIQYLLRAVLYLLRMTVLIVAIYLVMDATDTLAVHYNELVGTRGLILVVALLALSIAYPSYGYVSRTAHASFGADRAAIIRAFMHIGYALHSEESGRMTFRAEGIFKRVWNLGDDKIVVRPIDEQTVEVSGLRKEVVQVIYHIAGTTQHSNEE